MIARGDTIVALASAPGPAPRAILRLSGSLEPIASIVGPMPVRRGVAAASVDLGGAALPCLVLRSVAPASYTGEDALELLIPGGPAVIGRVMTALLALPGVRAAEPGEFSARAYLAGKLGLDQAAGVQALIAASSEAQLRAAGSMLDGSFGARARGWSDRAARLLALVEAGIDFTDQEDVTAIAPASLAGACAALADEILSALGAARGRRIESGLPIVAIMGRPSVGKSTLFNALLGRERAVTDAAPGTTRDVLREPLKLLGGVTIELVDLPGLDSGDAAAMHAARRIADEADLCLVCDDLGGFDDIPATGRPALRVRTKSDRVPAAHGAIGVCGLTGLGLDELREAIARALLLGPSAECSPLPVTVAARLVSAESALRRVASAPDLPAELLALSLRAVLDELGLITGRVGADDVLGLVFSSFCVGK